MREIKVLGLLLLLSFQIKQYDHAWVLKTWYLQGEELKGYGGFHVERHPQLKVRVVDGSGLAVAVVVNSIPKGTVQVLFRGRLTKVAYAIALALCQRGIQVNK